MAKQIGVFPISGKLDNVCFYMTRFGPVVRKIGIVSKERYESDPRFERRRNAASDFGYAGMLTRLLKAGVKQCCPQAGTGATHNRLMSALRKALLHDLTNGPGQRKITSDNVRLLEGLSWRERNAVQEVLNVSKIVLDAAGGSAVLDVSSLVPAKDITLSGSATHVQLTLALVAIDSDGKKARSASDSSVMIALNEQNAMRVALSCTLEEYEGDFVVAGVGVQGYQMVGGTMVPLVEVGGFEIGAAGMV